MDPLSVTASVVGLLGAGTKLSSLLFSIISKVHDAPGLARTALQEIIDITAALSHLEAYVNGQTQANSKRGSLILLEQVLTTLTGCVTTYSDLQSLLDGLKTSDDMRLFDRVKWVRYQSRVMSIVQRLQNHKTSLSLMLSILQCESMKEAEASTERLCSLVEHVLQSNADLAERMKKLEREGLTVPDTRSCHECSYDGSLSTKGKTAEVLPSSETSTEVLGFTFEQDLRTSRVYNRAIRRHSMSSFASTALYTTALSVLSKLSLSQVSNLSFYVLPLCAADLSNSQLYAFGEEGAAIAAAASNGANHLVLEPGGTSAEREEPDYKPHVDTIGGARLRWIRNMQRKKMMRQEGELRRLDAERTRKIILKQVFESSVGCPTVHTGVPCTICHGALCGI
ncbi:hypothetical protein NA57DRAFT_79696 [Rhizodiscina lignyota]|uniref:Fungal N-terminal domain-containing protein n=1 Tax=Rhizodiscina lignyota TaxID=1504668 RepID=A0A9P4I836_9PEZI|nr:hypothetical protein NA57DRAFT_79696 [Rhizodiscina lignyota]